MQINDVDGSDTLIIEDAMRRTTAAPRLVPAVRGLLATGAGRKGALNTALQFHAPLSPNMYF